MKRRDAIRIANIYRNRLDKKQTKECIKIIKKDINRACKEGRFFINKYFPFGLPKEHSKIQEYFKGEGYDIEITDKVILVSWNPQKDKLI